MCAKFSDWALGDIVLVQHTPDLTGELLAGAKLTVRAQLTDLQEPLRKDYRVTHAGLYAGRGMMIDATPGRLVETVS